MVKNVRKYFADRKKRFREQGLCGFCGSKPLSGKKTCETCLEKRRPARAKAARQWREKLRNKVFDYYGRRCECCGENTIEFLTIDHMNGDGHQHREKIGQSSLYRWLEKNNFPDGYQVLCYNCNIAKHFFGVCPHQRNCGDLDQTT